MHPAPLGPPGLPDTVRLSVPCTPEHARAARTTAAACATMAGFSVDRLDDLRLVVDEVFVTMSAVGVQQVDLSLAVVGEDVHVAMSAATPVLGRGSPPDTRIAALLADVLAADVRIHLDAARPTFEATLGDGR
jgi:hypothetical protein